nr:alpha-2,8-polysialyltransferase family protein [Flexivirga aerilata]
MRRADIRRRVTTVVTDEGIGTYGDWRTRRDAWRRQGVREPWTTTRALAIEGAVRGLTTTRFPMYDESRDFALHPGIAAEFRRHSGDAAPDPADGRVVFLGSPWVEIGALTPQAYLAHVDGIARRVAADGGRLVIRPHPAEDPARYAGREVIAGDLPAELDPQVVGASAVIGGASTALLNLAALHGMPATRVLTPGLEHLESELGERQRALLDRYLRPPAGG